MEAEARRKLQDAGTDQEVAGHVVQPHGKHRDRLGLLSLLFLSLDDPEIKLERNMVLAYHSMLHAEGEAGGVAIENTYRITETGCENLTPWPYEEIQILGL